MFDKELIDKCIFSQSQLNEILSKGNPINKLSYQKDDGRSVYLNYIEDNGKYYIISVED